MTTVAAMVTNSTTGAGGVLGQGQRGHGWYAFGCSGFSQGNAPSPHALERKGGRDGKMRSSVFTRLFVVRLLISIFSTTMSICAQILIVASNSRLSIRVDCG